MQRRDREAHCVFCGRPIAPDEPSVGRGATAAHASCADEGLRDERSWDRVAAALGDAAPAYEPAPGDGDPSREPADAPMGGSRSEAAVARTGCMIVAGLVLLVAWSIRDPTLRHGTLRFRTIRCRAVRVGTIGRRGVR